MAILALHVVVVVAGLVMHVVAVDGLVVHVVAAVGL